MKIAPINNVNNANNKKISFKGYAASTIKALYMHMPIPSEEGFLKIAQQLQKTGDKEGFDVFVQMGDKLTDDLSNIKITKELPNDLYDPKTRSFFWNQDFNMPLEDETLLYSPIYYNGPQNKEESAHILAQKLNFSFQKITNNIEGGNTYIGKKPDGTKYAIVGKDTITRECQPEDIKQILGVDQVHVISQGDVHIDLVIRPLNYPYVLVADDNLMMNILRENGLTQLNDTYKQKLAVNYSYNPTDTITEELNSQGFEPIKVPGRIVTDTEEYYMRTSLNYMNAIVHQRKNGDLVYITNKSDFSQKYGFDFESMFEKNIKKQCPQIKEVVFIEGEKIEKDKTNTISQYLDGMGGGVHCLVTEKPDFRYLN